MVRLDKCVEALYDSVTADNRTKSLQILTVMKGAISMSRSKTGECIFRTNKNEKKNLERLIKIEGRNANYSISQIDLRRKNVMSRWSKVLQNQTSCSSEALFEELMEINDIPDINHETPVHTPVFRDSPEPRDTKLKTLIDLRLEKLDSGNNTSGFETVMASRRRRNNNMYKDEIADDTGNENSKTEFVTERKQIRRKYSADANQQEEKATGEEAKIHGAVLSKTKAVHLPSVRRQSMPTVSKSDDVKTPTFERDLTDWGNWSLKDKSWINGYLQREKTRHEDLIIRNALHKIETDLSGANLIKRQQFRQKLQNQRIKEAESRRREHAQKEAEIARDLSTSTSAKVKSSCPSEKKITTHDKPSVEKHVAFQEPLSGIGSSADLTQTFPIRETRKSKRRYKPISTGNLNHLPMIQEGSGHNKLASTI